MAFPIGDGEEEGSRKDQMSTEEESCKDWTILAPWWLQWTPFGAFMSHDFTAEGRAALLVPPEDG